MIKMNYYVQGRSTLTTADLLRGASETIVRVADSLDKPNDMLRMLNEVFPVINRDNVADRIEEIGLQLVKCATDLRGPVIDERPMPN